MKQNCLGVMSMAGCLSITSFDPCYIPEAFYLFSIINISSTIAFKVIKIKNTKTRKKNKRGKIVKTRKV